MAMMQRVPGQGKHVEQKDIGVDTDIDIADAIDEMGQNQTQIWTVASAVPQFHDDGYAVAGDHGSYPRVKTGYD